MLLFFAKKLLRSPRRAQQQGNEQVIAVQQLLARYIILINDQNWLDRLPRPRISVGFIDLIELVEFLRLIEIKHAHLIELDQARNIDLRDGVAHVDTDDLLVVNAQIVPCIYVDVVLGDGDRGSGPALSTCPLRAR